MQLLYLHKTIPLMRKEVIQLVMEMANFKLCFEIDLVIIPRTQSVFRLLAILAHHDDRRLERSQTGEQQVQQDERIRIGGL